MSGWDTWAVASIHSNSFCQRKVKAGGNIKWSYSEQDYLIYSKFSWKYVCSVGWPEIWRGSFVHFNRWILSIELILFLKRNPRAMIVEAFNYLIYLELISKAICARSPTDLPMSALPLTNVLIFQKTWVCLMIFKFILMKIFIIDCVFPFNNYLQEYGCKIVSPC